MIYFLSDDGQVKVEVTSLNTIGSGICVKHKAIDGWIVIADGITQVSELESYVDLATLTEVDDSWLEDAGVTHSFAP